MLLFRPCHTSLSVSINNLVKAKSAVTLTKHPLTANDEAKIIRQEDTERNVFLIWRVKNFREIEREETPANPYDARQHPWYKQRLQL